MHILFDHGTPRGISRALQGHIVKEARAQGWDLSPADRWPHYGILYYLPAYGVGILMSVSGIRGIGVLLKKISKAKER